MSEGAAQKKSAKTTSSTLSGSSEGSDSDKAELSKSARRALHGVRHIRRRIRKHPGAAVKEWEKQVRRLLGITPGQVWTLQDWRRTLLTNGPRGVQRPLALQIGAYELGRAGQSEACFAQLVQGMKTLAQVTLHDGDWRVAWIFSGREDPVTRPETAASEAADLEAKMTQKEKRSETRLG